MISPAHPSFFLEITKSPGRQPLAGRLQAAASSVRVIFQSVFQHRAVLCPLGIPTHAINQTLPRCCSQVNSSTTEHKRTPNSLYNNKTQIIPRRFPFSNNVLLRRWVGTSVQPSRRCPQNGYDLFLANRVARGGYYRRDSRLYPFLTPNGPGIYTRFWLLPFIICEL